MVPPHLAPEVGPFPLLPPHPSPSVLKGRAGSRRPPLGISGMPCPGETHLASHLDQDGSHTSVMKGRGGKELELSVERARVSAVCNPWLWIPGGQLPRLRMR
ncbi:unnamed protein product [Pipistrellus nathusii]|uniref:Uncharacterized protein n=1 Tax=Pipistrellus nathusii TaxID=59473 RepID=A0ABP0A773_PIPNA